MGKRTSSSRSTVQTASFKTTGTEPSVMSAVEQDLRTTATGTYQQQWPTWTMTATLTSILGTMLIRSRRSLWKQERATAWISASYPEAPVTSIATTVMEPSQTSLKKPR